MSLAPPAIWGRLPRMDTLAWFALGSLAVWVWLLLGQGFFWRTDQRLPTAAGAAGGRRSVRGERRGTGRKPPARTEPDRWPRVAVVVPARDEAGVLPSSLPSLLAQDYPGVAEVILVDDGSTDGTGRLAAKLAAEHGGCR